MLKENTLPKRLRAAREKRGWSIYQASTAMNGVYPNTLRTLEGLNPDRSPACDECKLKTVLEVVRVYWPDVTLDDFAQRDVPFKLVAKDAKEERRLRAGIRRTG